MKITADTVNVKKINHTGETGPVKVGFAGINEKALTEVEIEEINSNIGTYIDGLWAANAQIHSNTDYFYFKNAYLEDKGLFSNNNFTVSVYGRNPVLDGSDVVLFFTPIGGYSFTDISFQHILSTGGNFRYVIYHASKELKGINKDMTSIDKIAAETQNKQGALESGGNMGLIFQDGLGGFGHQGSSAQIPEGPLVEVPTGEHGSLVQAGDDLPQDNEVGTSGENGNNRPLIQAGEGEGAGDHAQQGHEDGNRKSVSQFRNAGQTGDFFASEISNTQIADAFSSNLQTFSSLVNCSFIEAQTQDAMGTSDKTAALSSPANALLKKLEELQ
jgi:hypothetical protein